MVAAIRDKVYLETSFVSACVTTRSDAGSVFRRGTSNAWWETQRQHFQIFASAFVIDEISDNNFRNSQDAVQLITPVPMLPVIAEVTALAEILIREKVMPRSLQGDAGHVACATVYGIPFMLSWNVKHLANPNKVRHLETICRRLGYLPPQIVTPEFLWRSEP